MPQLGAESVQKFPNRSRPDEKESLTASVAAVALAVSSGYAAARDQIQVAGSSTVLPYAKIVAEPFGETFTNFKTPVVESGGSAPASRNSARASAKTRSISPTPRARSRRTN